MRLHPHPYPVWPKRWRGMPLLALVICLALAFAGWGGWNMAGGLYAQMRIAPATAEEGRLSLNRAVAQQKAAEARAQAFEREAARAGESAEKAERNAAALAARIQASEAELVAGRARLQLIGGQRQAAQARLAAHQQPVMRLTAALQNLARRPVALALMRPGSVRDMVYLRAALASTLPQVQAQTEGLRAEIANLHQLVQAGRAGLEAQRKTEAELEAQRKRLAALATRQRVLAQEKGKSAMREADKALALAEEARDLDTLADRLDQAGRLRRELEALPGPIMRPAQPELARVSTMPEVEIEDHQTTASPASYRLPVLGRVVTGFGAATSGGMPAKGLSLAAAPRAQVVAPARGRVVFAGPYQGYGLIVILEHNGGWTSLITGMGQIDVSVGQEVIAGGPLGQSDARGDLALGLELRYEGQAVNPIDYLR